MPVSDKVIFGTTVIVADENNNEITYKIVGEDEADLKKGKISVTSPISRAIVGKSEGDEVTIKTPSGNIVYEILEVKYV
jgi:transcription elongation factor GreA